MKIPLSSISLSEREKRYVDDAVTSGWISGTGGFIERFEDALARRIQRRHVVAVSNGTLAIELALRVMAIGPGDEVIVPALTFVAPAASVCAVGACPVIADIDAETWTLAPREAAKLITPRTKAIITVDLLGHPSDYDELMELGVPIIEDAAQAHGARYRSRPVGSFGVFSTFSFHANKTITCGEGGCVATDDDDLAARLRLITNHGMTKDRPYWHSVIGRNFRMTNLTAAVGLGQVERWDELVDGRNAVAAIYDGLLGGFVRRRPVAAWAKEACWLYTVAVPKRDAVVEALRAEGIDARAIWIAVPDLPPYRAGCRAEYPVAREIARTAFWLPTWSGMPQALTTFVAEACCRCANISTATWAR